VSVFYPHHHADHDAMVHEHGQFTDTVGDAVIRIQDEAYALGRIRGKKEADAELLKVLGLMVSALDGKKQANEQGQPGFEFNDALWAALEPARAAIARATGTEGATP
jgi:hypothetical protein